LIQLWYTAIIALQPRLPSVIPAGVPWQLMNKANSSVMSPFRNALSRNFPISLSLSLSLSACSLAGSLPAPTRSFNNGLSKCIAVWLTGWPWWCAMAKKFANTYLRPRVSRVATSACRALRYQCRLSVRFIPKKSTHVRRKSCYIEQQATTLSRKNI